MYCRTTSAQVIGACFDRIMPFQSLLCKAIIIGVKAKQRIFRPLHAMLDYCVKRAAQIKIIVEAETLADSHNALQQYFSLVHLIQR